MSTTFNAGGIGGHPKGLTTLFFTEFWERFSYYGMRAILTLFMVGSVADGGLGLDVATAAAIYGFYTAAVFFMGIPGGWIADRLLGQRDAGFSIFYMGINMGAFLSPLVCGTLAERVGWHWGFGAAGVGMTLGLIQYVLGGSRLGHAGIPREKPKDAGLLWCKLALAVLALVA